MRLDEPIDAIIAGRAGITRFAAGTVLFLPGEASTCFYILRSGRIQVTRELEVLGDPPDPVIAEAGWVVGAMGVWFDEARLGTATAIDACSLTVIEMDRLRELVDAAPGIDAAFVAFAGGLWRRGARPVPDAFGPLRADAFDPPKKYATAVMRVPPIIPGETAYPPLRALPGRKRRKV